MKFFICLILTIGVWMQLCSASFDITTDRYFPLYDLIVTKANEFAAKNVVVTTLLYTSIWPKFNETIANHPELIQNTKDFEEFSQAMNDLYKAAKELDADTSNCDLLMKANHKFTQFWGYESAKVFENFDNIGNRTSKIYFVLVETIFKETITQLSQIIENFQESSDASDHRQQNGDFLPWCQNCLKSDNDFANYVSMKRILDSYKQGDFKTPSEICKWQKDTLSYFIMAIEANFMKSAIEGNEKFEREF